MPPMIPHIDFGPFLAGSNSDRRQVALEVDAALCSAGSFYLHNHGINKHEVGDWLGWSKKFFNLPEPEKTAIPFKEYRGYSGVGNDLVREQPSLKESFDCGNPSDASLQNQWPSENVLPGFRGFTENLFKSCTLLVHQLLRCLSLALDLDSTEGLNTQHAASAFNLSLIHYPALSIGSIDAEQQSLRNAAHSDFGSITLLFQDEAGGLEVADMSSSNEVRSVAFENDGKFIHVDPEPGAILIVICYLMMRRTNSRWKNTVHRVAMPPQKPLKSNEIACGVAERYSLAFFGTPDPDSVIEPLECCCTDQNPKKWASLDVAAYLRRKREAAHQPQA